MAKMHGNCIINEPEFKYFMITNDILHLAIWNICLVLALIFYKLENIV